MRKNPTGKPWKEVAVLVSKKLGRKIPAKYVAQVYGGQMVSSAIDNAIKEVLARG